ncbi:hypothetical protein PAXRUDRAFT_37004 [Paxillus rubicundulus Ve08.2h10]|uniref:Uncharacterized protein n=1 Tax=Paxillus rubicundulus Ve08.2h10 TaxID=930991 RepID=A0A0D0CIM6_9AGAM|nr:hypothetical protein PAXRUDRAFT_37004 [Paxillus rubicundulus Ve08.2h10]
MLAKSGLSKAFWGEALSALVHVWNRCPTEAVDNATSHELWHGQKPDASHLRMWSCTAYVHVQRDKHDSITSHLSKCMIQGLEVLQPHHQTHNHL